MKRILLTVITCLVLFNYTQAIEEENVIVTQIWPESALSDNASVETERKMPSRGDDIIRITDITAPEITIYNAL